MATKKKITTKPKQKTVTPKEWGKRYEVKQSLYKRFTEELHNLIKKCLENRKIDVAQIQSRTKTVKRFVEKIQQKGEKYKNPLKEITDLSGARIIAYYKEDVDAIVKMIEKEFEIDWENSADKTKELPIDRFGYQSDHYVISLSSPRKDLVEWKPYKGLKAEIQVRTGLQHVWAERDHKLRYESFKEAPSELGRRLFRLSAVLELADSEFSSIRELRRSLKEEYSQEVAKGELDIKLNIDSLTSYLVASGQLSQWFKIAEKVGLVFYNGIYVVEPAQVDTSRRNLLRILKSLNVLTIQGFDSMLKDALEWGKEMLSKYTEMVRKVIPNILVNPYSILEVVVLYSERNRVNKEIIAQTEFMPELQEILEKLLGVTTIR